MLVLGLLLVLLALGLAAIALFLTEGDGVELAGQSVEPLTLYVLGAATVAVLVVGWVLIRTGTRRGLQHRRERRQLEELSAKLDRVEGRQADRDAGRHADGAVHRDPDRDRDGDPTA